MKKKIVFIINNIYCNGGMARVTLTIIDNLLKTNNYNVSVVSFSKPVEKSTYEIPEECNVIDLPLQHFSIRRDFLKVAHYLRKMYPSTYDGTFVVDDVGHNIPAWIGLKHCKKAKFISWSHMNFFNGSKYGFSGWGKRLAVKKFDYLIALTKEDQTYYKDILQAKNVVQIYNPIDPNIIKHKYNSSSKKIISCGRLVSIKGFDLLIEVARKVFENAKEWQWDIYGDGPERDRLQKKIAEYGLEGKVNLLGYCSNIFDVYEDYSFYVFTSRGEGCPMAMIEALAMGLPMISFDFKCGPRDLIVDGINGYIVEQQDLEKMAECIIDLTSNKDKRILFAQKADMNLRELDLSYVIEQWNKLFQRKL